MARIAPASDRHAAPPVSPAAARVGLAALVAALLGAGLLAVFPHPPDCDIWWHLAAGEVIVGQKRIPTTDPFTFTAAGRPWVTHEWLAEVIFFAVDRLGGLDALIILKALLAITALAFAAAAALTGAGWRERLGSTALGALLAGPLLATRAFARPHMFTAALLGLVLWLLCRERATGRRAYVVALVPVFWTWANLHAGFVLGLALVALFWLGALREIPAADRAALLKKRLATLAALLLVTLLNPNHVHALLYPLHLVARAEISGGIQELRPIFHAYYDGALFRLVLVLVAAVMAVLLAGSRRSLVWAVLVPGVVFAALSLRNLRGVSEFAVLVPALVGWHGAWLARRKAGAFVSPVLVLAAVLAGAPAVLRSGVPMGPDHVRRAGFGVTDRVSLAGLTSFLREIGPDGRLFNVMGFGGYLIRDLWPQRSVFIDGRLDIYPPGFLAAYGALLSTGDGWNELCERWCIALAAVDNNPGPRGDYGLRRRLRTDPDWVCLFFTRNAVIYARQGAGLDHVIARYGSRYDPGADASSAAIQRFVAASSAVDVSQAAAALAAWTALLPEDGFLFSQLGQLLEAAGRNAEAAPVLRRAARLDPWTVELRFLLARALIKADSLVAARMELAALIDSEPRRLEPLLLLAALQQQEGDTDAAIATVQRARALHPNHPAVLRSLEAIEQPQR